jgi:flagellar biosynthesis protein FlhF
MHIKKFTGSSVKEAMKAIKAELGDNALLLSSKRVATGLYEVVAAVDYDLSNPVTVNIAGGPFGGGGRGPAGSRQPGDLKTKNLALATSEPSEELSQAVKEELKELRELKEFWKVLLTQEKIPATEIYTRLEEEFASNGIDRRLSEKILMSAFKSISADKTSDMEYMKTFLKERVSEKIGVKDPLSTNGVMAFVGPAGVGKTTTVAKLAAMHAIKRRRKVALVTTDTYRIAAAEQLKVYGKLIGVPVEVARTSQELASYIGVHRDKDLVLIDTAGAAPGSADQLRELEAVAGISTDVRFNLVLSSQTRDDSL